MEKLPENWEEQDPHSYPGSISEFIGPKPKREVYLPCPVQEQPQKLARDHLCTNCSSKLKNPSIATMPSLCTLNNLQFVSLDEYPELQLTELGQQLFARNLLLLLSVHFAYVMRVSVHFA